MLYILFWHSFNNKLYVKTRYRNSLMCENALSLYVYESESERCSVVSNSPGQNTGVGSLSLFQGIFPTQVLNPGLSHIAGRFFTSWATIYVYIYIYIYTYIYTYIHTYMCIHIYIYIYTYIYICIHMHTHMHMCLCVCVYMHAYAILNFHL